MFSHIMVGSNDLDRSKTFYDALFTAAGGKAGRIDPKGRLTYVHKGALFMVSKPIDGQPACHANGGTIGLAMDSPEQVQAWHGAGLAHGGTRSRTRPASGRARSARSFSPICATRTATSSARSTASRPEDFPPRLRPAGRSAHAPSLPGPGSGPAKVQRTRSRGVRRRNARSMIF
jgi:catechol 2,3-dioxygenase-like lactoylglutathione lyase family enzyme